MTTALSLAIVGADYPNKRGPGRRFEIALCAPGDPVHFLHEPKNPVDANAIMVMSERCVCMGYVSADRTSIIHRAWRRHRQVKVIFQTATERGGVIRVTLDGNEPDLPPDLSLAESATGPDSVFWPDDVW